MDDLLRSRDLQEAKLNSNLEKFSSLESSQKKNAANIDALKDSILLTGRCSVVV